MDLLAADFPTWLTYGMATGLVLVILSRIILAIDSRLRTSKTGLLIGTGSVTLTVMMTLAFTGADDNLMPEFLFVAATGGVLFIWDCARLYARKMMDARIQSVTNSEWPEASNF
jgi:hypothetical protein